MISYKERNPVTAKITSKNQVTIPKSIRTALDIKSHDHIIFYTNEQGDVVIKSVDKKKAFWEKVEEQQVTYGSIDDKEMTWGEDLEAEDFD